MNGCCQSVSGMARTILFMRNDLDVGGDRPVCGHRGATHWQSDFLLPMSARRMRCIPTRFLGQTVDVEFYFGGGATRGFAAVLNRSFYSMAQQAIDLTSVSRKSPFRLLDTARRRISAASYRPTVARLCPYCNASPSFTWTQVNKDGYVNHLI
jgi:hypothetical protein